ncbi:hypothetical protein BCR34DRAFT_596756 [Clohesyomyces aquaticus]|uniref:SGNH hydrolase-type esterase domain-containing protein n=1 Tax=Clohesyomyces aquaticus TaxID=1231657 RepID=A0A1Y2A4X3_9PLEO|nr:hypothetical protein BCR34DRAFT_596756 [Clohesyomyces aquaticus]
MRDGNHEGHSGHRIDQGYFAIDLSSATKPNIYLINAGTNDCQQNHLQMQGTAGHLNDVLKKCWEKSNRATIILPTLLPSDNEQQSPGANGRVMRLNTEIQSYKSFQSCCEKFLQALIRFTVTAADLPRYMDFGAPLRGLCAPVGTFKTLLAGFITKADLTVDDGIHSISDGYRKNCRRVGRYNQKERIENLLQDPEDNGSPDDKPDNKCEKIAGQGDGPHLTQKGYGFDDGPYKHKSTRMGTVTLKPYRFKGRDSSKRFGFRQIVNAGGNPDPKGAVDEFIYWTRPSGSSMYMAYHVNKGDGTFDEGLTAYLPFDCPSEDVRWADSNGDLTVGVKIGLDFNGRPAFRKVDCFTSSHNGHEGRYIHLGDIDGDGRTDYCLIGDNGVTRYIRDFFLPKGKGDIRGTRYIDINGDGRSDWIWVGDTGDTDIYTNMRGPGPGQGMRVIVPYWLRASASHRGMRDYVWFEAVDLGEGNFAFTMLLWWNDASGGTQRKSDFDGYCDVLNSGTIVSETLCRPWQTGDGKCDIIKVERGDGTMTIIPNTYGKAGGAITFGPAFRPDKRDFTCDKQGWSPGIFGLAVRFADLNGDGRADYLCTDPNGRTEAILNLASDRMQYLGQLKLAEGKDRANHRFADVNGKNIQTA